MKDYKRLTERDEFGNADIIGLDSEKISENLSFKELNLLTKSLNRFAYFEDKIESGKLCDREEVRKETAREIADWLRSWLEWDEEGVVREIIEKYDLEEQQ